MEHSHSASYAAAGVNIEAGYEGVRLMKQHVERTFIPGVVSEIGGFGGLFAPSLEGLREPVRCVSRCSSPELTVSAQSSASPKSWENMTQLELTVWPCASTI